MSPPPLESLGEILEEGGRRKQAREREKEEEREKREREVRKRLNGEEKKGNCKREEET